MNHNSQFTQFADDTVLYSLLSIHSISSSLNMVCHLMQKKKKCCNAGPLTLKWKLKNIQYLEQLVHEAHSHTPDVLDK